MAFKWTPNHSLMIGNIIQQLGTAFMDEDQLRKTEKGRTAVNLINKVASSFMSDAMAGEGGKSKPDAKSKSTPSQHAGEGTHGVQPPSNPSNIHGAATTTGNQGAAHKARLEGLRANQEALAIGASKPTPTPTNVAPVGQGHSPTSSKTTGSGRQAQQLTASLKAGKRITANNFKHSPPSPTWPPYKPRPDGTGPGNPSQMPVPRPPTAILARKYRTEEYFPDIT